MYKQHFADLFTAVSPLITRYSARYCYTIARLGAQKTPPSGDF